MGDSRPGSWYTAPQPYVHPSTSQHVPIAPGAPSYPPVVAAGPSSQPWQQTVGRHGRTGDIQHRAPERAIGQPGNYNAGHTYGHSPSVPSHAQVVAPLTDWTPGHHATLSQPSLPTYASSPQSLSSPATDRPVRSKSPKLGSQAPFAVQELPSPQEVPRVHSPQPRRNTFSSPIDLAAQGQAPEPTHQAPVPARGSTLPSAPSRRPLPAPPQGLGPATNAGPANSQHHHFSASPDLSRSPSVASTVSSVSSSGSVRRRPLPPRPGPSPPGGPSLSRPPASYSEAQALAQNYRSSNAPQVSPLYASPVEEPAQVREMRQKINEMTMRHRNRTEQAGPAAGDDPDQQTKSVKATSTEVPSISVPTFAFDEADAPSANSGPAISISVAPPSPSLKATTSDYFESQIEDEGVPLPSSSVPMATSTKTNSLACPRCGKPVLYGRTVNAMGKRWHPDCFVCSQCETKLEHMEFFTKDGKPYCHVDYHELFSIRCNHCQTPIVDESYITIDDAVLGKRTYHELHFFCANCGDPFIDPKDQVSTSDSVDPQLAAKPFTVHNGYPYCENCNLKLHKPKCNNCKNPIPGDVLKALGKDWCENCFVCASCQRPFEDGTFVVHEGKPHCELCYKRIMLASS